MSKTLTSEKLPPKDWKGRVQIGVDPFADRYSAHFDGVAFRATHLDSGQPIADPWLITPAYWFTNTAQAQ